MEKCGQARRPLGPDDEDLIVQTATTRPTKPGQTHNRVELCLSPAYASWANPIGAHFGLLRQFTIANSNHRNHTVQTRALHACLRRRRANARHSDVLAAPRRERARIRSERASVGADVPSPMPLDRPRDLARPGPGSGRPPWRRLQ
ncbi:hypothetical protein QF032_007646 [Streptomyces achromogenes]|uniref:Transposase n=1 Tax=Streptomyces achromogenes TaxID=67255 RepID=A0ABU0QD78_STRAH|nr:hypothetical protein [Streptomyces achromogenes]MDQ0835802.1 hypothetical protein [Streptomyces achromogenes]